MQERLGIAGSGVIACGLAVAAARHGDVLLWARSDQSADRARGSIAKLCAKAERPMDARARSHRHGSRRSAGRLVPGRGGPRAPWQQGRGAGGPRRARPPRRRRRRARHDDVVAVDRRARPGERPSRAVRRAARLQPRAADGARRAGLPGRRRAPRPASGRALSAPSSARRRSRCPTCPASSSTGCSSRTCSAPWT